MSGGRQQGYCYAIYDLKAAGHSQSSGAERGYLFGFYARGDMHSSSDIDLRIDCNELIC